MYRRKHKKREQPTFPDTLEGFGYRMKETGEIRSFEDGKIALVRSLTFLQEI